MSIVSDALKKAQRMRQLEAAAPNVSAGGRAARLGRTSTGQKIALGAAALVALIAVAVAVTISLLQPDPVEIAARITAERTAAAQQAANLPAPAPLAPVVLPPPPTLPRIEPAAPPVSAAVQAATPAPAAGRATSTTPVASASSSPVARPAIPASGRTSTAPAASSVAAPATMATPRAPAAPDPNIQQYIDDLKIVAILSNPDPARNRVKLGEKIYLANDFIDRAMGLRLTEVGSNTLTFTDGAGAIYTKEFRVQ